MKKIEFKPLTEPDFIIELDDTGKPIRFSKEPQGNRDTAQQVIKRNSDRAQPEPPLQDITEEDFYKMFGFRKV